MLELSAHGGRSREKRLRGGGGRAHSFFLPPLRPLESFLFFPMAMRGKYAGGPSLAGTQVWAAPGPTTRTAPEDLEQKSNPDPAKSSAAGGAPLRTVRQRYNPPVVQDGTPPPAPLLAPLASCGLAAVATSAASAPRLQHSTRSRPPCSQRLSDCSCRAARRARAGAPFSDRAAPAAQVNFTLTQLQEIQSKPRNIRSMSVIAHVDHGKSR